MPSFKFPERNREYMRRYMAAVRLNVRQAKAARLKARRAAFLAREHQIRWDREARNILEGR